VVEIAQNSAGADGPLGAVQQESAVVAKDHEPVPRSASPATSPPVAAVVPITAPTVAARAQVETMARTRSTSGSRPADTARSTGPDEQRRRYLDGGDGSRRP